MSSALTRLGFRAARLVGVPDHDFAGLLGLGPEQLNDDLCRIPAVTGNRMAELGSARVGWTELAGLLVRESAVGAFGVWDYLIAAAPTPLAGIQDASVFFAAVADPGSDALDVAVDGGHVTVTHHNQGELGHAAACAVRAYALGLYRRRLSEAAGRELVPLRVTLAAQAPRDHKVLSGLLGTRAIDFEAPTSSITFLTADLTAPVPHTQPGLSTVLRTHAEHLLTAATPLQSWMDVFRAELASAHETACPTLAVMARRMNISVRTLQRRLEEHGTTWSGEVEALRRDRVTRLLRDTVLSVDAIAARTGYADARALRRAVRRWHDTTPGDLRQTGRPPTGLRPGVCRTSPALSWEPGHGPQARSGSRGENSAEPANGQDTVDNSVEIKSGDVKES
ncbi:AraC family transcriptional regulator [Streptomyces sp. CC208A]|uniref:helix-turn-helix domain-containing protein n=1 Tax=Streptomyces sp. CC208A TaxID=3044573 RepID=UPI0024A7FDBF|nr:AraC family transcriptional regulator [Streptomyces sp. CC208A]